MELKVTDSRQSSSRPTQLTIKNIAITGNSSTSLKNVQERIAAELKERKIKGESGYRICDSDGNEITCENIGKLKNQYCLVILDKNQTNFNRKCRVVPHTRAVTDQQGKFYGTKDQNPAAFAIAELVDNSLAATVNNNGKQNIEILFYDDANNPSLVVLDNGTGMTSETLENSLIYKAPKETRNIEVSEFPTKLISPEEELEEKNEQCHPMYVNSKISKFGAGLKQAVFWLGEETRIMTKTEGNKNVSEVPYSRTKMENNKTDGNDAWDIFISSGTVGELRDKNVSPVVKDVIKNRESENDSFTHIVIQKLKQGNSNSPLNLLRRMDSATDPGPSIEKQLAHIYHYYLHGRNGNCGRDNEAGDTNSIQITVTRLDARRRVTKMTDLRKVARDMLDMESKLVRSGTQDPFLFTTEVTQFEGKNSHSFKIGGIIRYHPFQYDHETNPADTIFTTKRRENEVDDLSDHEGGEPEEVSTSLFHIWWNGRLIPHTKLEALDWCRPGNRMRSSDKLFIDKKSFRRISGSIFLDSNISGIADNKLKLSTTTNLIEMLTQNTKTQRQSSFKRITQNGGELKMARHTNVKTSFEKWLSDSQKEDREVIYSKPLYDYGPSNPPLPVSIGQSGYLQYGVAKWQELDKELKAGDAIKLRDSKPEILGTIKSFYVEYTNCFKDKGTYLNQVQAPMSYFDMEIRPSFCAGEQMKPDRHMRRIDLDVTPEQAEELIRRQLNDFYLELKIVKEMESHRTDGSIVSIDELLFKSIGFDVVNKHTRESVNGELPNMPKDRRIHIYMVASIHKIHDDGSRTLIFQEKCSYLRPSAKTKPNGYYFTKFAVHKIGNYIITFQSYIENRVETNNVNEPVQSTKRISSPNCPVPLSRRASTPNSPARSIPYKGRKILRDGKTKIPFPYYQIPFNVVAGAPKTFSVENFSIGELLECRIGIPFNCTLSFKDSKGNKTPPPTLESLLASTPRISAVDITFSTGELSIEENNLTIKNITAEGNLQGSDIQKRSVRVKILDMEWVDSLVSFVPGLPFKIDCLDATIEIENGTRASLRSRVLDCSGNVILKTGDTEGQKIWLCCTFFKLSDASYNLPICSTTVLATGTKSRQTKDRIQLEEFKTLKCTDIILTCKISYPSQTQLPPLSLKVRVVPSTQPKTIMLYRTVGVDVVTIENGSEQLGEITDQWKLSFKLFDELEHEVQFDASKHNLKLSWSKDPVTSEICPRYDIPSRAETRKILTSELCLTSDLLISGSDMSNSEKVVHVFYLTSLPLEHNRMQAHFGKGADKSVPIGKDLPDIIGKIIDRYGNVITNINDEQLRADIQIQCDHLQPDFTLYQPNNAQENKAEASFIIKKLRLHKRDGGFLQTGKISLAVTFRNQYPQILEVNMTAGPPKELDIEINDKWHKNRDTYQVRNGSKMRVRARFLDAHQNLAKPKVLTTDVYISLGPKNDWVDEIVEQKFVLTDVGDGVADFNDIEAELNFSQLPLLSCPAINTCNQKCFGAHRYLHAHAKVAGEIISATCYLHITCRSEIPFKLIPDNIRGNGLFCYTVGSRFEHLTCTLEAEDGTIFENAEKCHLSLWLTLLCNENIKEECKAEKVVGGVYTFGPVPKIAGEYRPDFVYINPSLKEIRETYIQLTISPSSMHALGPDEEFQNLSASNDPENEMNRIIMREFKLFIKDQFGNPIVSKNPNPETHGGPYGTVEVKLPSELVLENPAQSTFPLANGMVVIPTLMVQPRLNLATNSKHRITFTAIMQNNQSFVYELEFTFYDNARQLEQIKVLRAEIGKLKLEIDMKERERQALQSNVEHVSSQHKALEVAVEKQRQLLRTKVPLSDTWETLLTSNDVDLRVNVLTVKRNRHEKHYNEDKSHIKRSYGEGHLEVLGPVGLLAEIKSTGHGTAHDRKLINLKNQNLLSWHLRSNINAIVTETIAKGEELEKLYPNKDFMMLEIVDNPTYTFHPLNGPGYPLYAKDLLQLTNVGTAGLVTKVFNKLLKNTIIMDDIKVATEFMKNHNSDTNKAEDCPTILTRDGRCLTSDGIIGRSTRMPQKWSGDKFGIAPSLELCKIRKELELLSNLKTAMNELEKAVDDDCDNLTDFNSRLANLDTGLLDLNLKLIDHKSELEGLQGEYQNQTNSSSSMIETVDESVTSAEEGPPTKRPRRNI